MEYDEKQEEEKKKIKEKIKRTQTYQKAKFDMKLMESDSDREDTPPRKDLVFDKIGSHKITVNNKKAQRI